MQFNYIIRSKLESKEGSNEKYESQIEPILCQALTVKVGNVGFTQQAVGGGQWLKKEYLNVICMERSFSTPGPLEAPYVASSFFFFFF